MRFNSTVTLTLVLLFFMVGLGSASAMMGYRVGREALRGVMQPDARPISDLMSGKRGALRREGVTFLREADIIANAQARINGGEAPAPAAAAPASPAAGNSPAGLPVSTEVNSVTLKVRSARKQNNLLLLDVSLKNSGKQPVRFLYSAMSVTNDQGRLLSADVQGLPEQLPADGKEFSGIISIPANLLAGANSLSIALTDYPDQQTQLSLAGIPVVQ